ncbi:MAG: transcription antitermination factor NusB [Nitrospinota bacterium]|nr:transcription antitermination factor NusB [Nitrospinota bacterium]
MGSRRKSRKAALGILYQCDIHQDWDAEKVAREYFGENDEVGKEESAFAMALADGVAEHLEEIDSQLALALTNWPLDRLGYMERSILRIGAFEILHQDFTPDKVAVDEAVELSKIYCDMESSKLINGALQSVIDRKAAGNVPGLSGEKLAG